MGRTGLRLLLPALVVSLTLSGRAATPVPDRLWFCPGPGTLDYIRLFEHPEEWRHARQLMQVFKFYQGHTQPSNAVFAPNTYEALARAGAFRTLKTLGKKVAIEVGAVKTFYCTPDRSGMDAAIGDTLASIRAVEAAAGSVDYLAMDEPFVSGRDRICGGPALEPTADRVATYVHGVQARAPGIPIGLIEAYPFSSEPDVERLLELLSARGVPPAFLHMDVDLDAMRPPVNDFTRDMTRLQSVCKSLNLPFGIIMWGHDPDADALYDLDAHRLLSSTAAAFVTWDRMPDQIIVQSWAQTRSGLWITPSNLPEDRPYTHTQFLWEIYRRLRGQSGPPAGIAVPR
jgi:hypothetical protein